MAGIVQSVERALSILEVLSDYNEGLGVTDISEKVGLHKSTVYRLLSTLNHKGYVLQDRESNRYMITLKLFELGNKRVEGMDILAASRPYTKQLMEEVNETVHLVIRDGNEIVYIDKVEADNTIRMASTIGMRGLLYCTSVGKAILAQLPKEEIEKIWGDSKIQQLTNNTITNLDDMKRELEMVRLQGYAIDNEENEAGVRCVGAPVFNLYGEVSGAISVSGPTIRVTGDKIVRLTKEVTKCAKNISGALGYKE